MRRFLLATLIAITLTGPGCGLFQSPEERYQAKIEELNQKMQKIGEELRELREAETRRRHDEWNQRRKSQRGEKESGSWWDWLTGDDEPPRR